MRNKKIKFPAIPRGNDKKAVESLTYSMETLTGATGNKLDKAVTYRDLQDLSIVKITASLNGTSVTKDTSSEGGALNENVNTPTKPTGFTVIAGYSAISIRWDLATYGGHAYTQIWRSETDVFADASLIATATSAIYSDSPGPGKAFYYWVRHVNQNDVKGAINATAGTYAQTAVDLIEVFSELNSYFNDSDDLLADINLNSGLGIYDIGGTPWVLISENFAVLDTVSGSNALKALFTVVNNDPEDPDIPNGTYIDTAYIKAATIRDLVAGTIIVDGLEATSTITTPVINGGEITGASIALGDGSQKIVMDPDESIPFFYGPTSDAVSVANAKFALDYSGGAHARDLTIYNNAGDILLDTNGLDGTYIKDLTVESLAIGDNAVSVQSYSDTSTIIIAANALQALTSVVHPHDGNTSGVGGAVIVSVTFEVVRTSSGGASDYIDLRVRVKNDATEALLDSGFYRVGQPYDSNQTYFVPFHLFVADTDADDLRIEMDGESGGEAFTLKAKVVVNSAKR